MPFAIQSANGFHLATLSGAMDSIMGQEMVNGIKAAVTARSSKVVLDCTTMTRMDMAGFKSLLSLLRWAEANDARLVLAGMSPENWQIIVDNHCGDRFESRPSVPAALQALGVNAQPSAAPPEAGAHAAPGDSWDAPDAYEAAGPEPVSYVDPFQAAAPQTSDPWADQAPAASAGWDQTSDWSQAPAGGSADDQWGQYERQAGGAGAQRGHGGASQSVPVWKKPVVWVIVGSVILIAAAAWLLMILMRTPELEVSDSSITVQEGAEPRAVTITVKHGELDIQQAEKHIPKRLYIGDPEDGDDGSKVYTLGGAPESGELGKFEVDLVAVRGKRKSESKTLVITVEEKAMEWQLPVPATFTFKRGEAAKGYSRLVTGAVALTPSWNPPLAGLEIKADVSNSKSWSLSGAPSQAGTFALSLEAKSKGGKIESKPVSIVVTEPPPPPPPPVPIGGGGSPAPGWTAPLSAIPPSTVADEPGWQPESVITLVPDQEIKPFIPIVSRALGALSKWSPQKPAGISLVNRDPKEPAMVWSLGGTPAEAGQFQLEVTAQTVAGKTFSKSYTVNISRGGAPQVSAPPPPPQVTEIDNRMRDLLMERIERANDHFTADERARLREMVSYLKDPKRIKVVTFGNGLSTIDGTQRRELRDVLDSAEYRDLLHSDDCQIMVVGYASPTGSLSTNVRLSKERARAVNAILKDVLGKGADLCGDYGPTDIISADEAGNRAVEIYAGKLEIPAVLRSVGDKFKSDFNDRHGLN